MPRGAHRYPVEPIAAGELKSSDEGHWIFAGADGSLHVRLTLPGALLHGDVVAEDEAAGIVLVTVEYTYLEAKDAVQLQSVSSLKPGDMLRLHGSPIGFWTMQEYKGRFRGLQEVNGVTYLDADTHCGGDAVGGPVVDSFNRVVGIATRKRYEKTCYIVAADRVQALLATVKDPAKP